MASKTIIHAPTERFGGPPEGVKGSELQRWAAWHPPKDPTVSYQSKTILVTGANTGLGFEATLKYAALGAAKLLLAVHSVDEGNAAKAKIVQRTGFNADFISIHQVDLGSFASVHRFVTNLNQTVDYIDVVLLNGCRAAPRFSRSSEGWEMGVQVDVLSIPLMGLLLLPKLRATAKARRSLVHLTFVNSIAHGNVNREWLIGKTLLAIANDEASFERDKNYAIVKLLGMAAMQGIARAAAKGPGGASIVVNACCPSLCKTDIPRELGMIKRAIKVLLARPTEEGARTLVSATALGPESSGKFWSNDILFP